MKEETYNITDDIGKYIDRNLKKGLVVCDIIIEGENITVYYKETSN